MKDIKLHAGRKLLYGFGINDADYLTQIKETLGYTDEGKRITKHVWVCPFYLRWTDMFKRCYSEKFHAKHPTYKECLVSDAWRLFMSFRSWMIEQDWEGKQLDKDILFPGNKIYGPDTCVFVDKRVNTFLNDPAAMRGEWPIGVSYHKPTGRYVAMCKDVSTNKQKNLGYYNTPEEAYKVYREFKYKQAIIIASTQTDPRVAQALLDRYKM